MKMSVTSTKIKTLGRLFIEKGQLKIGIAELKAYGGNFDQRAEMYNALMTSYEIRLAHVEKSIDVIMTS